MIEECAECRRLSESYESVTMAWFRIQGNLRIAECGHDENSAQILSIELNLIGDQRGALRQAIESHRSSHTQQLAYSAARA